MYCNYIFESGGIKGLAYVGALKSFEERGYTCFKAVGVSVGAIFASLMVAGYKTDEIILLIDNLTKEDLVKKNTLKKGIKSKGIYNLDNLESILDSALKKKGIETFKDVKFGDDYLLKVIVTDNKNKCSRIIPDELYEYGYDKDYFRVATAVAMSCSIPFFYSEYKFQKNRFVDGGATCRFPVNLIKESNIPIFGFKVNNESKLFNLMQKVFYKPMKKHENDKIEIINIEVTNISSVQFLKGLENRKKLYRLGYVSAKKFFEDKYK